MKRASLELLGFPPDDSRIQCRTGVVHYEQLVPDVDDLADHAHDLGVRSSRFIGQSNLNLGFEVELADRTKAYLVYGLEARPSTSRVAHGLRDEEVYGYSGKYARASQICTAARRRGVPCPAFLDAGVLGTRSYALTEFVRGSQLDAVWRFLDASERRAVKRQIGTLLARLHLDRDSLGSRAEDWVLGRWRRSLNQLAHLVPRAEVDESSVVEAIELLDLGPGTPVHLDVVQHNLLCARRSDRWEIVSLIDWETALPGAAAGVFDLALAAWWSTDEPEDAHQMDPVFDAYAEVVDADRAVLQEQRDLLLATANAAWYAWIPGAVHPRETELIPHRLEQLNRWTDRIRSALGRMQGRPHNTTPRSRD